MWLDIVVRWLHIGSAVVLLGGAFFSRQILLPAAAELPEAEHVALKQRIRKRWAPFVHLGITLLLLTGFYNYLVVVRPLHKGDGLYHALMGTKILLAFGAFFIASVLVGRSARFEAWRAKPKGALGYLIVLAGLAVLIGGYLKVARPAKAEPTRPTEVQFFQSSPDNDPVT